MFVYLFWLVCHVARLPDFPPVLLAVRRRARPPASATAITLVVSFFRKLLLLSVSGECASMVVPARMSCFCATRDRANGLPSRVESRPRPPLLTAKFIKDK